MKRYQRLLALYFSRLSHIVGVVLKRKTYVSLTPQGARNGTWFRLSSAITAVHQSTLREYIEMLTLPLAFPVNDISLLQGVELFSTHKAKGAYLLNAISKGHSAQNDFYWGHAALHNDGKYITLVSLQ